MILHLGPDGANQLCGSLAIHGTSTSRALQGDHQGRKTLAGVAHDGKRRTLRAGQLGRLDIDADQLPAQVEIFVEQLGICLTELRSHRQDDIGALDVAPDRRELQVGAQAESVPARQDALGGRGPDRR